MQLMAVTEFPDKVMAVLKETSSDGTMTIRTTKAGGVRLAGGGSPLQVRVKWGDKGPWHVEKFSDGVKIVVYDESSEVIIT